MAMRFMDSFDHYTSNAAFGKKWTEFNGAPGPSGTGARFGPGGMAHTGNTFWRKSLDAQATWIVGIAFRFAGTIPAGNDPIIQIYDDTTLQMKLEMTTARLLRAVRGDGTVLGTGTTALVGNVFYYLEFKVTINNSTGVAVVRINEATELNLTSQDTQNSANATANKIGIQGDGSSSDTLHTDDLYICDGTGGSNNDFLGDTRIEALFPNGNGNSSVLVGSDGNSVDNYLLVDETNPNDDTDYVESSTPGDKDTYTYTNLTPTTGTVYAVQPLMYARKTDAGARSIVSVARHSGTETDGAVKTLSSVYEYHHDIRETKPGGGTWSISDVNGAEFGMKVNA